jgi:hypothetical protein
MGRLSTERGLSSMTSRLKRLMEALVGLGTDLELMPTISRNRLGRIQGGQRVQDTKRLAADAWFQVDRGLDAVDAVEGQTRRLLRLFEVFSKVFS